MVECVKVRYTHGKEDKEDVASVDNFNSKEDICTSECLRD